MFIVISHKSYVLCYTNIHITIEEVSTVYALSFHPEYVSDILSGKKKIDYRTWTTPHRGDLLICSTKRRAPGLISGYALCVVSLVDIKPVSRTLFGWQFSNLRLILPINVSEKKRLFKINDSLIQFVPSTDYSLNIEGIPVPTPEFYNDYYVPLINKNSFP